MALEYNVVVHDFNSGEFVPFNVLSHGRLIPAIKKIFKNVGEDRKKFDEELKNECMYNFWSKCEYEIVLSSWPPSERFENEKVDVYDQLRLNWQVFSDYVWNNKKDIIKLANKYAKR